jgi:PadR family transcriptional regulator PadR
MPRDPLEIIQGTLEMLILKALIRGSCNGWQVLCWLRERAGGELSIEEGALYPALHRLERKRLVSSEWGLSENNRRARYYTLSERGRAELQRQSADWRRYVRVVAAILGEAIA